MATRRRATKSDKVHPETIVHAFPPIPRIPSPPRVPPDPRQARTAHILGAIAGALGGTASAGGANVVSGFPASAVDLGRLQSALERGLSRFDAAQIEARWPEVSDWMTAVIRAWVQRRKRLTIQRFDNGIRVEMQTQDDLGYYDYAFDVFPRRGGGRSGA